MRRLHEILQQVPDLPWPASNADGPVHHRMALVDLVGPKDLAQKSESTVRRGAASTDALGKK